MFFEGREIPDYAKPVSAEMLRVHRVYFSLTFLDNEQLFPTLEPIVFIGVNLEQEDFDRAYFQDLGSFQRGVRYLENEQLLHTSENQSAQFYVSSYSELNHVFEFERALDLLLLCSIQRQKTQSDR